MAGSVADVVGGFYRSHGIADGATVAVAFSGGADSVALLSATCAAGYPCVALHCNFGLRGEESDRDERFARQMASRLGCEIRVVHFDVGARCAATGESVEMACRELRYEWFEREFGLADGRWACVAVAHNANDNLETFFLNLMRGTGLKGLGGMPAARGIFMRPLLEVPRDAIIGYLQVCGLDYVVDSSNLSNDYRRNMLRNDVIPCMSSHFPRMDKTVSVTMSNIRRDSDLLDALLEETAPRYVDGAGRIDLKAVAAHPSSAALLYHLLNRGVVGKYDFSAVERMLQSLGRSGARFYPVSGCGGLLLDRGTLIPFSTREICAGMTVNSDEETEPFMLFDEDGVVNGFLPLGLDCEVMGRDGFAPERNARVVWIDLVMIPPSEPLMLRRWRQGDRIEPFGMRGSRLVSDVLSDAKVPLTEKRDLWLLVSGEKVLWVPGLRASRHYAINYLTKKVLKVSCRE